MHSLCLSDSLSLPLSLTFSLSFSDFLFHSLFSDSSAVVPLVFILSAGSDPMGAVFRAADMLKTAVDPISLGQGQV